MSHNDAVTALQAALDAGEKMLAYVRDEWTSTIGDDMTADAWMTKAVAALVAAHPALEQLRKAFEPQTMTLLEYIKANPPDPNKPFAPNAWFNREGNMIHFTWDKEDSYAEEVKDRDGKKLGKVMRTFEHPYRVTGVSLYIEAAGIKVGPAEQLCAGQEWTKEPPKVAGWHWFRTPPHPHQKPLPRVLQIEADGERLYVASSLRDGCIIRGADLPLCGEWCGPLVPPQTNKEQT